MFLNGNFVALPAFQKRYGVFVGGEGSGYAIPTKWQSALFQSGQCGAFIGVFLAGPVTNWLGYRWTTILALMLMNATIFISFFVSRQWNTRTVEGLSSNVLFAGRLSCSPHRRSGPRGRPMGLLYRQLACLRQ